MQFVSRSVLVGYISGAGVLIIANQSVHLLGLGRWVEGGSAASFAGLVVALVGALRHVDWVSLAMGVVALACYFGLLKWKPHWPVFAISLALSALAFGPLIHQGVAPFGGVETFDGFGMGDLFPGFPHLLRADVFNDISILLGAWGPCGKGSCVADIDGDGSVGPTDIAALLAAWG